VWPTFVYAYVPLYINLVPVAFFYEWNHRYRYGIVKNLSDTLRKLASANDSGQTLFEAMATVSDNSDGRLATEFDIMSAKVSYGTSIKQALTEFNNKYRIPRMARTIKLIAKAQEASGQITKVLTTAAQASENQDDIDRQRKSRARMQVVIIMMTYLTLLAVMAILKTQFLEVMAQLVNSTSENSGGAGGAAAGQGFGASIDVDALSMLFFHAVTLQAIMSGVISGYMRDASIVSGFKYTIILMTIALSVWIVVG
jgi:flagellar protein FlaJ